MVTYIATGPVPRISTLKVLWLHQGRQIDFGETGPICDRYQSFLNGEFGL